MLKKWILDFLVCPVCHISLRLDKNFLCCPQCFSKYTITDDIPYFSRNDSRTSKSFGWEWQHFSGVIKFAQEQFFNWVYPLKRNFFKNKIILDAGCGMGRFPKICAELGAKRVIGIDISDSVKIAKRKLKNFENVSILQADINNLPFNEYFDFIYSIGVIHHLTNPREGFKNLLKCLKPGGSIFIWVYGYENNAWIRNFVNPIRNIVSKFHPFFIYCLSFFIALFLHPAIKHLKEYLPYRNYFKWLSQFNFLHTHHVIHDHLGAPIAYYLRKEEIERWLRENSLKNVFLYHRNKNSWSVYGEKGLI